MSSAWNSIGTPEDIKKLRELWAEHMTPHIKRPITRRVDAKKLGLKRYFSGKPCAKGHLSDRLSSNGTCLSCTKESAATNPRVKQRVKARLAKYRATNKEKCLKDHAKWRKANKDKMSAHYRNRRAREKRAEGRHTAEQIADLYGKQHGKCANCFCALEKKFHADHVQPLAKGGSNDIRNIQLLCPPCNIRKHAKDPIQWANEQGRLL